MSVHEELESAQGTIAQLRRELALARGRIAQLTAERYIRPPADTWHRIEEYLEPSLEMSLVNRRVGRGGAMALSGLNQSRIRHITLDLRNTCLGDADAVAIELAALKDAPSLHRLHLDLGYNGLGEAGARALAGLKDAPSLNHLALHLKGNDLADAGAQALAALKGAPFIQTLTLDLTQNGLGVAGARALATLTDAPSLLHLHLHLRDNSLGDAGVQALAALNGRGAQLKDLRLGLMNNRITDGGVMGLAILKDATSLRSLALHLGDNDVGCPGARALADALKGMPQLHRIDLNLKGNSVGNDGACAFTAVGEMPLLNWLHIDLRDNWIHPPTNHPVNYPTMTMTRQWEVDAFHAFMALEGLPAMKHSRIRL